MLKHRTKAKLSMSVVTPKLLYCQSRGYDLPVWELSGRRGNIYFERVHHSGFLPVGSVGTMRLGNSVLNIYETVGRSGNTFPEIYRERDGYVAHSSWYEKIHPLKDNNHQSDTEEDF